MTVLWKDSVSRLRKIQGWGSVRRAVRPAFCRGYGFIHLCSMPAARDCHKKGCWGEESQISLGDKEGLGNFVSWGTFWLWKQSLLQPSVLINGFIWKHNIYIYTVTTIPVAVTLDQALRVIQRWECQRESPQWNPDAAKLHEVLSWCRFGHSGVWWSVPYK